MSTVESVSIIIANYNGEKYLPACLSSLLLTSPAHFEVIIYDDGSTDNSRTIIKQFIKKDKRIRLVIGTTNIGASAARNKSVRKATGNIVVFLDNDTQVDPNWLKYLLDTLKDPKIGACQALLVDYEDRSMVQFSSCKLWAATAWALPQDVEAKRTKKFKLTQTLALSTATAVRKEIFNLVGGFDEKEGVFTEDLDFFWRVWIAGFRTYVVPQSIVYHWNKSVDMRKGMKINAEKVYFHLCKNSLRSIVKNYEFRNMLKFLFTSILINFGRAVLILVKRKDASAIYGVGKAMFWMVKNLKNTFKERKKVAIIRKLSDSALFSLIIEDRSMFYIYNTYFKQTGLI